MPHAYWEIYGAGLTARSDVRESTRQQSACRSVHRHEVDGRFDRDVQVAVLAARDTQASYPAMPEPER